MKRLLILLLVVVTAAPVFAQAPTPPPVPGDVAGLYSHLLYIEARINTIETQGRENHTAELAELHEVHELIIVQAERPNPIVALLSNEKFWTLISATVAAIAVIWQQQSK